MNDLAVIAGLAAYKPFLTAWLLPPVPMLVGVLVGALLMRRRPWLGGSLVVASVSAIWLGGCIGFASILERQLLDVPPAIGAERLAALKAAAARKAGPTAIAVVVLGGGREDYAPEYGGANLTWGSLERLRYGVRLARAVGAPLAFSGGIGWAQRGGPTEASVAAGIAESEFGVPMRWIEDASRDTRENAWRTMWLLAGDGVSHVLLVTHGWHMPRALRAFRAAGPAGVRVEPVPMGLWDQRERPLLDWMPSSHGHQRVRQVLREAIGIAAGS